MSRSPRAAESWLRPSRPPADTSDHYAWAVSSGVYIAVEEVESRLLHSNSGLKTIILDVRDDDAAGGHIAGAHHFPDSTFVERTDELLELLRSRRPELVVLHCMESVRRGPRCAKRLREVLEEARNCPAGADLPAPSAIRVLRGGADRWLRRHWKGLLVEGWDDAYWGWEAGAAGVPVALEDCAAPAGTLADAHRLYSRPAGQQTDTAS